MYILNVEDDPIKHHEICKVLSECCDADVEWSRNLQNALDRIRCQFDCLTPYELVITDMWYPRTAGGPDEESGEILIKTIQKEGWRQPMILCSSIPYNVPDIVGNIWYSKSRDWESELKELVKMVEKEGYRL